MKNLLAIFSIFISVTSSAQNETKTCNIIIDPDYKGDVIVYDEPYGKQRAVIKQNYKDEDFLIFNITNQTKDFFYGTLEYSISEKKVKGWVKKARYVGVYARNYSGKKLNLYSNPSSQSHVISVIPEWINRLYQVTSYNGNWAYVEIVYNGQVRKGWLNPDMQCSNPYTTCN